MHPVNHAELLELSGIDPWVRWGLADPLPGECWVHAGVAMVERVAGGGPSSWWVAPLRGRGPVTPHMPGMPMPVLSPAVPTPMPSPGMPTPGEAVRLRSALTKLRDGGHLQRRDSVSVSVAREHAPVAHEVLALGEGGDWDWMWTTSSPTPDPREDAVVPMDDCLDAEELRDFTHRHNPRVWTEIGTGRVHRWVGLRDDYGALLAIGGAEREGSGADHLAGIVVDTAVRGQGLGRVISAALTRHAVEHQGVCTLGVFADNVAAHRVYEALGYRIARAWHSRRLVKVG